MPIYTVHVNDLPHNTPVEAVIAANDEDDAWNKWRNWCNTENYGDGMTEPLTDDDRTDFVFDEMPYIQ